VWSGSSHFNIIKLLLANDKLGIEILVRVDLLAVAFPSKAPALPVLIGLWVLRPDTCVHPVLTFGVKELIVDDEV
jgi:hypothetical protein